ncbi:hypothetical protein Nepgr_027285 [Nepenthes gracilis]|uniref:Uncharacterized protein n=1 Tax=Nepenthes gracilis TaxID=150966 RepID=A0AAD3TBG8_NEPGR|nr:hypothetical protein Nepgr_027285 [Nepenthes gracilis]
MPSLLCSYLFIGLYHIAGLGVGRLYFARYGVLPVWCPADVVYLPGMEAVCFFIEQRELLAQYTVSCLDVSCLAKMEYWSAEGYVRPGFFGQILHNADLAQKLDRLYSFADIMFFPEWFFRLAEKAAMVFPEWFGRLENEGTWVQAKSRRKRKAAPKNPLYLGLDSALAAAGSLRFGICEAPRSRLLPSFSLSSLFHWCQMAPVHFVPNPISSLYSENESPIFADTCSNHCGNVVAFSNPEDLPSLVNPTSPPFLTSLEPLVAALTKSILANGVVALSKSSSVSSVGVPACSESESGPARLSSLPPGSPLVPGLILAASDVRNSILDKGHPSRVYKPKSKIRVVSKPNPSSPSIVKKGPVSGDLQKPTPSTLSNSFGALQDVENDGPFVEKEMGRDGSREGLALGSDKVDRSPPPREWVCNP